MKHIVLHRLEAAVNQRKALLKFEPLIDSWRLLGSHVRVLQGKFILKNILWGS